jgi:enamine deaminase RidA (YjgF/YER057c/UK114 family)
MTLKLDDRIQETSVSSGTGTITLDGAVVSFRPFSTLGDGNTTYYAIVGAVDWEVGQGTYNAGTLSRDTVFSSSNSNNLVNFTAENKNVFVDYPASIAAAASGGGVASFNTRTGAVTLLDTDVTGALGATAVTNAVNATNAGNATTVTNGVYTTGSYANPTWITGLDYSKLTGTVPTWNQNTTGNAATVTNGVYTTGSYSNPTWLPSVALTSGTISTAPASSTDIVNKSYADSIASGINFHAACQYATVAALATNTYSNGASGVGATLTAVLNGALIIDGYTFTTPDIGVRVLIKDEVTQANNGVYTITAVGGVSAVYVLTRATDYDTSGSGTNEVDQGDLLLVINGTVNANTSWVQQTPLPITIGSTSLVFIEFAAVQTYTAGTGLTLATNQFSITNTGTAGTYGSASLIPVITTNAQGQVTGVTTEANPQGTVTSVAALTLGTTGTDLSSTVATGTSTPVITLQVPTASAANRGALSAADWSTFNGKQAALGYTPVNSAGDTMTGTLNLAAGTTTIAPLDIPTATNLMTTAAAGSVEFDGTTPYFSIANSTRGAIVTEQWVVLTGTNTLTSQTGVQPIFDGGGGPAAGAVTLPIGTYQFECNFALTGMSATSGSFGFGLAGAATKTFSYQATSSKTGTSLATAMTTNQVYGTAANTAIQTGSVGTVGTALIKGIIRVTVAGTVIPQVSLTQAAAAVVQANSYFRVSPIGNATVAQLGNWS